MWPRGYGPMLMAYLNTRAKIHQWVAPPIRRYIGVGEEEQVQLFYYFIKYEGNPEEDPILLWLSGGPGCSSISGLLYENDFEYNSLDQPVGTGFSYSTTHKLASKPSDSGEAKCIHEFLHKWLNKHQEFVSNPFYGNPEEDPILLWLSGGPGCSSISGFLYENDFEYNSLDQPVGTGFSYSTTHKLASKPSDSGEAKRIHEFLHKWLNKHQEFVSNPFYVGGPSINGIHCHPRRLTGGASSKTVRHNSPAQLELWRVINSQ
ncbi:hypothetical protein F2Q70_00023679 [Brassica cretica]|uniref:Uncharacterized protein n=1 Tax=Brassica cretica TaxID=69181 RepID=A0A8S9GN28_BRACR|nr:hypothetical protein F2Q70_00023679 [Brassica cretica]